MVIRAYRDDLSCPRCDSNWLPKAGRSRGRQMYRCGSCSHRFTPDRKPLALLVDALPYMFQAWHRWAIGYGSSDANSCAVYGLVESLLSAIDRLSPTHVAIAFDPPPPTFRHALYPEYKGNRPPADPRLIEQFDRARDILSNLGVSVHHKPMYEADDLLGTLSSEAEAIGVESVILTNDTDLLQLVSKRVKVLIDSIHERRLYDAKRVCERFNGIGPEGVAAYKALVGDSADNLPGVRNIGKKTAVPLLKEYGSIPEIYAHLDKITSARARNALSRNMNVAFEMLTLTTIRRDVDVSLDMDLISFDDSKRDKVKKMLSDL